VSPHRQDLASAVLAVQAEANVLEVKIAMDQEVAIADVSPANPVVASSFL
jgi:hypothetical protein